MTSQPSREETGKEDQKTVCLFSGVQFKYPVGVVSSISREGSFLVSFLRGGVRNEATPRGGVLALELPPKHSRLFGYMDTRGWDDASTQTSREYCGPHRRNRGTVSLHSELATSKWLDLLRGAFLAMGPGLIPGV